MDNQEKNSKSETALREERILKFWQEKKVFEETLAKKSPKGEFVFYEGPPTANAKPALHHLEARAFKDVIPRYKTMRGYHVRRKAGWDTHGLPVELQVEKKLELNSKKAIEEYGVAKFNRECRESVWEYVSLWDTFTERIGFWVDQEHPYVTYHNDYIESVWNIVKKVDEQRLLFKDYKVVPWCPRCGTALSSHELAQGYQDDKDLSVCVKFKVKNQENNYILAWTTTPWTLPGNVALAVGKDIEYVKVKLGLESLILAKDRLAIIQEKYEIEKEMKGKEMIGLEYEPLFPFLADIISESERPKLKNAFKIYPADFVNTEEGTGIVHTAVMYGQDDFILGTKVGLPKHHLVDPEGKFIKGTGFLEGRFVKETDANGKPTLAVDIIENLKKRNLFFNKENYQHSYPHCWRCKTALIYYARDSWYIKMSDSKIKKELIGENKKINWEPEHIREGRFGEWLKEVKDWAVSRERYWGTPLPVWLAPDGEKLIMDSLDTLKKYSKKSGNRYFVMRHGGTEANKSGAVSFKNQVSDHLTEQGKMQTVKSAAKLKKEKIDYVITSNFVRTKETAQALCETLGLSKSALIEEPRLREMDLGDSFDNKSWDKYHAYVRQLGLKWFEEKIKGGESFAEVKKRTAEVLYGLEEKYKNKNIVLVTHGGPCWLLFVNSGLYEPDDKEYQLSNSHAFVKEFKKFENAEIRPLPFIPLPHDENLNVDLHRPYIDDVLLVQNGKEFRRVKEVMDVWFDSGAMPFAQDHYPFENKKWVDGPGFPADYISEAIDQTRGWFYTLHAIGVLMGRGRAYKNVICLGHLLDEEGKKMSKSVGNIVDPWTMMDKYGVDTLRLWMYSVNQPGESKNFDEKTVRLLHQQFFGLLYNVLAFYELYRDKSLEIDKKVKSADILDQWILARLNELVKLTTENLDAYKLLEPTRATRDFINDVSTWYLRRSRERIKNGDAGAKATLYYVLKTLAQIMAPFAPFSAEDIWQKLKNDRDEESVHLTEWPKTGKVDSKIIEDMEKTRTIVSLGLEARQKAKIQVRQPLNKLKAKSLKLGKEYLELIKDELNVKEVVENKNLEVEVELDTKITPALKAEGEYREFMRELQDMRKKKGLNPNDKMPLPIEKIYKKYKIMPFLQEHMLRVAAAASLICDNFNEPLPKDEIITTCLLHDMGNIIKAKLDYFPEAIEPEGMEYWAKIQNEYISKYGENEHGANLQIIKELGLSETILNLANQIHFSLLCEHANSKDMSVKIIHCADGRVGPHGILSYDERMAEGAKRYKGRKEFPEEGRQELVACGKEIEKQIFSHCKIRPEDINDETVAPIISKLKDFVIK